MFTLFLAALLTAGQPAELKEFRPAEKSLVSKEMFVAAFCDVIEKAEEQERCWQVFEEDGKLWVGDVNEDGADELLIYPGRGYSGSGGEWYFIFQKHDENWVSLFMDRWEELPHLEVDGWQTGRPRFDILPIGQDGYHDLRVTVDGCLKWDGEHYIFYDPEEYHQLSPSWFAATDPYEAEIFWSIRYGGLEQFTFAPQWFPEIPGPPNRRSAARWLDDPLSGLRWAAYLKAGVWGVNKEGRGFLLLPRPGYAGSLKLEFEGDWLVIYAYPDDPPVARYNRRTGRMRIEASE